MFIIQEDNPDHWLYEQIKNFAMDILKKSSRIWVKTMIEKLDTMWETLELDVSKSSASSYFVPLGKFLFSFLTRCIVGADISTSPEIADSGFIILAKWLGLQLIPTINIGIIQPFEELFLHSFAYPFWLVQSDYNKLVEFVKKEGKETVQRGQNEFNLTEEETVHNLLFILGFNAFGGFALFFNSLLSNLGDNANLQEELRKEVREKIGKDKKNLNFESVKELEMVQSFVYETLRLNPPVPSQFARARKDFKLMSHDSVFEIKKGELLYGYQPIVMRDSKVFDDAENFVLERFTKEKGKEMLNYLYWSNGPHTGMPSESNKQCAGKDIVTLTASLFVANMFQRYDSVTISSGSIKALQKAK